MSLRLNYRLNYHFTYRAIQRSLASVHPSLVALLLLVYISLLWRSSRKLEEVSFIVSHPTDVMRLFKVAHKGLLKYCSEKLVLLVAKFVLVLKYVSESAAAAPISAFHKGSLAIQDSFQANLEEWLNKKMDVLGDKTKQTIGDPFMPEPLLVLVNDLVDSFLPDAKRLLLIKADEMIRYQSPVSRISALGGSGGDGLPGTPSLTEAIVVPPNSSKSISVLSARNKMMNKDGGGGGGGIAAYLSSTISPWTTSAWTRASSFSQTVDYYRTSTIETMPSFLRKWLPSRVAGISSSLTQTSTEATTTTTNVQHQHSERERTRDALLDALGDDDDDDDASNSEVEAEDDGSREAVENGNRKGYLRSARSCLRRIRVLYDRSRSKILYISSPCDKSIWECVRDWRWVSFTLLGMAPYGVGTLWWLFLFLLHDKRDEYQVCNFIVGFMCAKFAGGIAFLVYGAVLYYACATREVSTCRESGPRVLSEIYDGVFFFLQIFITLACFFLLPHTQPCRAVSDYRDAYLVEDMERVHERLGSSRSRGGRLVKMFWWDGFCVVLVFALATVAHFTQPAWQLRATLYWLKTLFGLLAMPFVFFKIPLLSTLLMQVRATGYNLCGRVVLHKSKTFVGVYRDFDFTFDRIILRPYDGGEGNGNGGASISRQALGTAFSRSGDVRARATRVDSLLAKGEDGTRLIPQNSSQDLDRFSPRARLESQHLLEPLSDDDEEEEEDEEITEREKNVREKQKVV